MKKIAVFFFAIVIVFLTSCHHDARVRPIGSNELIAVDHVDPSNKVGDTITIVRYVNPLTIDANWNVATHLSQTLPPNALVKKAIVVRK